MCNVFFFFQAEDGIRYLVRSRGLGDVYKRQILPLLKRDGLPEKAKEILEKLRFVGKTFYEEKDACLLYTSDAADERSSVDLGGRRIIKKKKQVYVAHDDYMTVEHNNQ